MGDARSMPKSVLDLEAIHPSAISSAEYQGNNAGLSLQLGKLTGGEGTMNVKGLLPMGRHDTITKVSLFSLCLPHCPWNPSSELLPPPPTFPNHILYPPVLKLSDIKSSPKISSSQEPRALPNCIWCTPQTFNECLSSERTYKPPNFQHKRLEVQPDSLSISRVSLIIRQMYTFVDETFLRNVCNILHL